MRHRTAAALTVTIGGRAFVFSVLVNGAASQAATGPLDSLIAAVAAHPG